MDHVTRALHHWLAKNDLPIDGVRIIVEFPERDTACRAEMCIKREIEPMMAYYVTGGTFGKIEKMNGIGLTLAVKPSK